MFLISVIFFIIGFQFTVTKICIVRYIIADPSLKMVECYGIMMWFVRFDDLVCVQL